MCDDGFRTAQLVALVGAMAVAAFEQIGTVEALANAPLVMGMFLNYAHEWDSQHDMQGEARWKYRVLGIAEARNVDLTTGHVPFKTPEYVAEIRAESISAPAAWRQVKWTSKVSPRLPGKEG